MIGYKGDDKDKISLLVTVLTPNTKFKQLGFNLTQKRFGLPLLGLLNSRRHECLHQS